MTPETVFDGDRLRALLFPGRTPDARLVVTFDYRMNGRAGFSAATHSTQFARQGHAQLSIKSRANDWFVNPETPDLEAALAGLGGRFASVHLLGYSMGGYGALRFARTLGARSIVAVSPQVSIDPRTVPFDRRYRAEAAGFDPAIGALGPHAMPDLDGVVVLDPFVRQDLRHAKMIAGLFPKLRLARLAFGGHPALRAMRRAGKAWVIQREAVMPVARRGEICRAHRLSRRQSPGYWTRLAERAEARRPALARHARDRADALGGAAAGPD